MNTIRKNIIIYLWTIPVLLISGLIIYFDSSLDTCYGLVYGFGDLTLLLILFVFTIFFLSKQVYKIAKRSPGRKERLRASLIVIFAAVIALQGKSTWKEFKLGKSTLKASIHADQLDIGRIELIDNERYYALYGHVDWSCAFTEYYQRIGDTVLLNGRPYERTEGIIADKYILTDSTLVPIKLIDNKLRRTEIMKIEKKTSHNKK